MSGSPEDREIGRLEAEVEHLRQRAERAERILAELREPSEAVVMMTLKRTGANAIRAAVGAAEILAALRDQNGPVVDWDAHIKSIAAGREVGRE